MFRAVTRYIRALGYLVTGRLDSARKSLSSNPQVVQATYDHVIEEKKHRVQEYKGAVARMIAQQESKTGKVRQLTEEVNKLEKLKEGAAAKARTVVRDRKARGDSMEQIKQNEEYLRCMTAYNDFTSTEEEKSSRISDLEADAQQIDESISSHKVQLQQLMREIDKLREEASESETDIITANEEQEISDMLSGVSTDRTSQELQDLRDLRQQSKAKARVSRELAGTDTKSQEAEFLDYARSDVATHEFDELIGLAEETDREGAKPAAPEREEREEQASSAKLPEG